MGGHFPHHFPFFHFPFSEAGSPASVETFVLDDAKLEWIIRKKAETWSVACVPYLLCHSAVEKMLCVVSCFVSHRQYSCFLLRKNIQIGLLSSPKDLSQE